MGSRNRAGSRVDPFELASTLWKNGEEVLRRDVSCQVSGLGSLCWQVTIAVGDVQSEKLFCVALPSSRSLVRENIHGEKTSPQTDPRQQRQD